MIHSWGRFVASVGVLCELLIDENNANAVMPWNCGGSRLLLQILDVDPCQVDNERLVVHSSANEDQNVKEMDKKQDRCGLMGLRLPRLSKFVCVRTKF
jgi:hypothetical protein